MAKKSRKNQRAKKSGRSGKRQRRERYWIEDCPEQEVENPALTVIITRVELSDEHPTSKQQTAMRDVSDAREKQGGCSSLPLPHHSTTNNDVTNRSEIAIKRYAPALSNNSKFAKTNFKHLPDGDCGDGIKNPHPKTEVADKYWAQRHRLFSKFDEGIVLDNESWFSVTPEAIANHVATRMANWSNNADDLIILDAFCGAGGNAIAFAKQDNVSLVICVDIDERKLGLAAKNASIYNIPKSKIVFICADACQVLRMYKDGKRVENDSEARKTNTMSTAVDFCGYPCATTIDVFPDYINQIFLSPPWGGVDYGDIGPRNFDLKCIELSNGVNGETFLQQSLQAAPAEDGSVVCFLPRNTNGLEVAKSALNAGFSGYLEMEQNVLNDKFKAITAYMVRRPRSDGTMSLKSKSKQCAQEISKSR